MLYCQRHPDLNIPTPAIYAYNCTYGSEFIAMEYIDGDILSDVWLDLPEEEKECMANQVAEIMRTMRTKTAFNMIGGISPDGSACPLVDGVNVASGRSVFDRKFYHMDQMLHKGTLSAHEAQFREEIKQCLFKLSPEDAFECVKSKRDDFMAHPYDCEYPFVLRHGDLHGRNVIVSRSDQLIQRLAILLPAVYLRSSTGTLVVLTHSRSLIEVSRRLGQTATKMLMCV
ncbi:hypothetical protein HD554DRAFT_2114707 [Boletus coccyginus]|nr:hypothetical protein HD554DRAFT_2114707 [Boletus coccyginus]